jgi:hypothetical protein
MRQASMKRKLLKKKLSGFSSNRESMTLKRIHHVSGNPRYALQIIPSLERAILRTMFDDFAGMLSADALNGREFGFGGSVQIHILRHTYSFWKNLRANRVSERQSSGQADETGLPLVLSL